MPSILSDDDKQTVKRTVPKSSNKIHAVAVAKLYIAHPNTHRWTYTGLQGAAVLANDLVGNTFWIKLVDVSPANRGVLWDQEIYDVFQYNQDRTFFHSFELEDCMAGLSFADEKEAKLFKKKMDEREKNAHKNTRQKPFASVAAQNGQLAQPQQAGGGKHHSRFGLSNLLGGHRNSVSQQAPVQSIIPPRGLEINAPSQHSPAPARVGPEGIDLNDPAVQVVLQELVGMGITEDQIEEHAGFIKSYLEQHKAQAAVDSEKKERAGRAPPPPPPPVAGADLSPQHTGSSSAGKRGPPPAAPPPRRGQAPQRPPSPEPSPPRAASPPRPRFRAPPPIADAGRFAQDERPAPALPNRNSGPVPPPRPPKTPLDDEPASQPTPSTRFAVPPPFTGNKLPSSTGGPPPPPPARAGVPPAPPPRESRDSTTQPALGLPPPPPPRVPNAADTGPPLPPPLPPTARPVPSAPAGGAPPPPPLPPSSFAAQATPPPPPPPPPPFPTMPSSAGPPPPPPLPPPSTSGGPPPPPPMPPRGQQPGVGAGTATSVPQAAAPGRDGLLADIRGGARLKKVSDTEKRDRSAAQVPGGEATAPPPSAPGAPAGGDAQGGLAGALASALAARKSKVSHSDDEDDNDDW